MSQKKSNKKWRIAYVCPRYTPRSAGGAEVLIQNWAERMARRGHYSEVLTTCARDHFTWENEYPAGEETIGGVTVRRFPVDRRDHEKQAFHQERILRGGTLSREEEEEWINEGVRSEALFQFLRDRRDAFDCFIFAPYLFGVTYHGLKIAPEKSILVPCLHDEPYAYLRVFSETFSRTAGLFFNSEPERELARRLFLLEKNRTRIVGMGIESPSELQPGNFRQKFALNAPFLLYAGRREGGKNTPLLIEYFRAFKRYRGTDLTLVLVGTGEVNLKKDDRNWIRDLKYLSEGDKWDGYAAATAFIQPSVNESFSIVLLESWRAGRPALVNAFCPVTVDHCLRSQGGLFFRDYYEFEECLLYLVGHPAEAGEMGKNGQEYVRRNFSWENVLDRLETGIGEVISGQ